MGAAIRQYRSAAECLAGLGTTDQARGRLPELAALGFQFAIRRGWAQGQLRSLAMGIVDIAFLSYPVYLLGPTTSVRLL